ncbi:MAG: methyltransferase domain-containing protein [Bacteroidota bacterium]
MKLHRSLVQAIIDTLQQIFVNGVYADKAVEQRLKQNSRWGSRDRRFIAETTYEMVRWWRRIAQTLSPDVSEIDSEGNTSTSHYYKLFGVWQLLKGADLPDWNEFAALDRIQILKNAEEINMIRKYRESIPDWLDEIGTKELGETVWESELHELNKEAQVVLRVNTLKISTLDLQKKFVSRNVDITAISNDSSLWNDVKKDAFLVKRQNLYQFDEYKQGLFEVQDASSQLIGPFLKLSEGMTVIDACAGAGGKSLHIAALMRNKGKIISMDVEERKLIELKKRAERAGVSIIHTQLINPSTINKLKNTADRLLLDVPCSGLGVIRRNPDAKWKLSLAFIEQIKNTQQEIISNYSKMLKPGGIMVYATCSILPGENQNQVEQFLSKNKNEFEFIEDRKVLPSEGFDGFYMAAIKRL